MSRPTEAGRVASPCISVCEMDGATGFCRGCLRTLDEIAVWSVLDDAERRAVWKALAERRGRLAVREGMQNAER